MLEKTGEKWRERGGEFRGLSEARPVGNDAKNPNECHKSSGGGCQKGELYFLQKLQGRKGKKSMLGNYWQTRTLKEETYSLFESVS